MCAGDPIEEVDTTLTGGFILVDGLLRVRLGSSVSRECGNVGCDGWQLSFSVDAQAAGPRALGTEVPVHFTSAYSSCAPDEPGEVCNGCTEDDRFSTDEATPWMGTVEVVAVDDDCVQLRLLQTDALRFNNDPSAPTSFGVDVTRCD